MMCATDGCSQKPKHAVFFKDPEQRFLYCKTCAYGQYSDPKAYAMMKLSSLSSSVDKDDLPEFEEMVGDDDGPEEISEQEIKEVVTDDETTPKRSGPAGKDGVFRLVFRRPTDVGNGNND
jgi:hypothetical protein